MTVPSALADSAPTEAAPYDFARPHAVPREQLRELSRRAEAFARTWRLQLGALVRGECVVSATGITVRSWEEHVATLPATTMLVLCAIDGLAARAVVDFEGEAALRWLARMAGGAGAEPLRAPTAIERGLLARIVSGALETMAYTFADALPSSLKVEGVQSSPHEAKAAAPTDAVVVLSFELASAGDLLPVTFAVPAHAVAQPAGVQQSEADAAAALREQLSDVPVRIALQFAPTVVDPELVLGLVAGDVVRLSHTKTRPLDVAVDGHVIARAAVGASGSRLACVVVEATPEEAP